MNKIDKENALSCELQYLKKEKGKLSSELEVINNSVAILLNKSVINNTGTATPEHGKNELHQEFKEKVILDLAILDIDKLIKSKKLDLDCLLESAD